MQIFLANLLIFLSTLKELILFLIFLPFYSKIQKKYIRKLVNRNKNTQFDADNEIRNIENGNFSLTSYDDYQKYIEQILLKEENVLTKDKVLLLEPTSGTTSATKYIPYTKSLQKEFNRAINPWLAGIYLKFPKLFCTTQYWSISPELKQSDDNTDNNIKVGFEQDGEYLGKNRSRILNIVMTVPEYVKQSPDYDTWIRTTSVFLLKDRKLGLISIWHPSFLTIIVDYIRKNYHTLIKEIEKGIQLDESSTGIILPGKKRAVQLNEIDIEDQEAFSKIWPKLKLISCWADNSEENCLKELKKTFPNTHFQGKGLIATEGIVSFPFGKTEGLVAYRSHYFEFIDVQTGELNCLHQLKLNKKYEVIITTGGGLYRYSLNDIVRVKGYYRFGLPMLQFLYKHDYISDIRGEKLSLNLVHDVFEELSENFFDIEFYMLAPVIEGTKAFYTLFVFSKGKSMSGLSPLLMRIDEKLKANFHYKYARDINQLEDIRLFQLDKNPTEQIVGYFESKGVKRGDVKISVLSKESIWADYLDGYYLES